MDATTCRRPNVGCEEISTLINTSDLGTKGLQRNHLYALIYMIGFVDENASPIGELEYQAMIRQGASRKEFKEVCRHIARTEEPALRTVTTCTSNVQLAKKILAVTVAADILPKAYGQVVGDSFFDFSAELIKMEMVFVFRLVVLFYFIWLLGDEANTFLDIGKYFAGMFLVYDIGVVLHFTS